MHISFHRSVYISIYLSIQLCIDGSIYIYIAASSPNIHLSGRAVSLTWLRYTSSVPPLSRTSICAGRPRSCHRCALAFTERVNPLKGALCA